MKHLGEEDGSDDERSSHAEIPPRRFLLLLIEQGRFKRASKCKAFFNFKYTLKIR